jgi:hypothetical protein
MIAQLSAVVLIGTQFLKRLFLRLFKVEIKGAGAVALSIIVSIAVLLYYIITNDLAFDFNQLVNLIEIIIASNTAHNLIRGNNTNTN